MKGKGPAIADPATPPTPDLTDESIFALAAQIEALLSGKSNKTCHKVMNMVGSIHGIRCVSVDRPIGRSTVGTTKVVPTAKAAPKGQSTPKSAWKQTENYRSLQAKRSDLVSKVKANDPALGSIESRIEELRTVERELKGLKSPKPGNC